MLNYKLLQTDELSEALDYLSQYQKIKMISGGTDILVDLHNDEIDNEEMNFLLDISNIKELKKIKQEKEYIEVGALVTHNTLIEDKNLSQHYPVLEQAAKTIGSIQIRNRGTIGGNIVNASSKITFKNIPSGKYAVNILHYENKNGKIDKGFILPIEGIGFSNFQSIGFKNKPNFSKASFTVKENKSMSVKMIYM
jgi:uncharacterized protein (DUF2141 family)